MKKCILSAMAGALAMLLAIVIVGRISVLRSRPQRNMNTSIMCPTLAERNASYAVRTMVTHIGARIMWALST